MPTDPLSEHLEVLRELHARGLISDDDYATERRAILEVSGPRAAGGRPSSPDAGRVIGTYRVLERLGKGGMGTVHRARHLDPHGAAGQGGDVAIKILYPHFVHDPKIATRFEHEATLGALLQHPGLVRVLDFVADRDTLAIVMELVSGRPLSAVIGREVGPMPWPRARPLVEQLLSAVEHAHDRGVVHRDLKPENVMLDAAGRIRVLDFGIARNPGVEQTQTGTAIGTPEYMAPEQFVDASRVDKRADVYSLGMTLFEMLAGRLPYEPNASIGSILRAKHAGELPSPTRFYPAIPSHVVAIIERATRKDPSTRYASCAEMRAALAAGEASAGGPVNRPRRVDGIQAELPHDFGRFRLIELLGRGAMGAVYRALVHYGDRAGSHVALKLVDPALAVRHPDLVLSLADEARVLSRVSHPNVVSLIGVEEIEDGGGRGHALLLEYVWGRTLEQLLRPAGTLEALPLAACLAVVRDLLAALEHVHRATDADGRPLKLVHRDLKPHNVMVDTDGAVKLLDFGIAWATERLVSTGTNLTRGTLPYMSPEQIRGRPLDGRADLFVVGLLAYELLTGTCLIRRPKTSRDMVTLAREIVALKPTQWRSPLERAILGAASRAVGTALVEWVGRLLAVDRDDRPATAAAALAELDASGMPDRFDGALWLSMRLRELEASEEDGLENLDPLVSEQRGADLALQKAADDLERTRRAVPADPDGVVVLDREAIREMLARERAKRGK